MRSPCVALPIPKVHGHLGGDLEIEILEDVDVDDDVDDDDADENDDDVYII